jgi:two-component system osmolarity sensor histidine kinase EnvZ
MQLMPRSLLWRTFLLIAALIVLALVSWFAIFKTFEREMRARQLAQTLASVANLTRVALVTARPEARRELLRELSDRESIHIYPAEADDQIKEVTDHPFLQRLAELLRERMGSQTRLAVERDGEEALFVSFRIDDSDEGDYWLALPRERIDRNIPLKWFEWGLAAILLALAGAWLIVSRITRPLHRLTAAAKAIGEGQRPPAVPESGPEEIAALSCTFNRMSADLARIEDDRALLLAGISHDLRTPLTRLRMGIEMSGADSASRDDMAADIEELDATIGQFLDFARNDAGEAIQHIDVAALLEDLAAHYRRRGVSLTTECAELPPLPVRLLALRRALVNLIENALRHAGEATPIDIRLAQEGERILIDVADRGPGIPAEETERLKQPFARSNTARSGALGAGLGLAIVDRVARIHGGHLELLPRDGGGLLARIALPRGAR